MPDKNLIVRNGGGSDLYQKMETAISACYSVDDCKHIADQASGIAAYYKQIKDDESVRKFICVKLRAWRRIGEICQKVDKTGCETQTSYYNKINQLYPDISISQISTAIRLSEVPDDFFQREMSSATSVSGIIYGYQGHLHRLWEQSPQGKANAERARKEAEQIMQLRKKEEQQERKRLQEEQNLRVEQNKLWGEFVEASAEVGYTMDRRDRKSMKTVVLLLNDALHSVLRQAAFDKRMTMQAILRKGLETWLICNGYEHGKRTDSHRTPTQAGAAAP